MSVLCISATIFSHREILCLPYSGFLQLIDEKAADEIPTIALSYFQTLKLVYHGCNVQ